MFWAEHIGLDVILNRLKEYHDLYGDDFKPSPLLEALVSKGKGFQDFMEVI